MSHDRGCFQCGAEQWDYHLCKEKDCPKADLPWIAERRSAGKVVAFKSKPPKSCQRCNCTSCTSGYENHEHHCTRDPNCVEMIHTIVVTDNKAEALTKKMFYADPVDFNDEALVRLCNKAEGRVRDLDEKVQLAKKEYDKLTKEHATYREEYRILLKECEKRNIVDKL